MHFLNVCVFLTLMGAVNVATGEQAQLPIHTGHDTVGSGQFSVPIDASSSFRLLYQATDEVFRQSWNNVLHIVNITIGTPPQHFNASLDLESSALFVPSTACDEWSCKGRRMYNSSLSSSYLKNGSNFETDYWGQTYSGFLSEDNVALGSVDIDNQMFEEFGGNYWRTPGGMDDGFDGMLGLAPPWDHDQEEQGFPNFLTQLLRQETLKENVMSFKYAHAFGKQGELMLGGSNPDLYTGSFRNVSFLPDSLVPPLWQGKWNLPISSITFNTSHPIYYPTPNYTATLTSMPFLLLPTELARNITYIIGAQPFYLMFGYIPCDRRPYLPELSFEIAGEVFTIDAFDYTFEWGMPYGFEPLCVVWIGESEDYGAGDETVALGTTFLKRWYTRWDLDERSIGFAELKSRD